MVIVVNVCIINISNIEGVKCLFSCSGGKKTLLSRIVFPESVVIHYVKIEDFIFLANIFYFVTGVDME